MNEVYVLDTGAVYRLHNTHRPPLRIQLEEASFNSDVWIPALVLTELGQAKELYNKRMEMIGNFTSIADITEHVANRAAEGLRTLNRSKCKCGSFIGPSLVDAIVMAFAHQYFNSGSEAIVFTSDRGDMETLRDACFEGVTLIDC